MSRILHIDTSGTSAIAMVAIDGIPVAHKISETERDHAGKINYLVADVLEESRLSLRELDAIAVCNGPGSYTGLRIGLATAKAYCYALDKPLILHNRLSLLLRELDLQITEERINRLAILPARVGEYYVAASGEYDIAPRHIKTTELLSFISGAKWPFAIIGKKEEDMVALQVVQTELGDLLNMSGWAVAAFQVFTKGNFSNIAYAEPEYLKSAFITSSRTDR